jgi:hypothetical protein
MPVKVAARVESSTMPKCCLPRLRTGSYCHAVQEILPEHSDFIFRQAGALHDVFHWNTHLQ